ncbi:MAG: DUF86 domain-containing protein [Methanomassiliicoccaceae archaeon]|nr:DUF86 domain-containing protein [Methanomassiliicoccaceae archaeon]
MQIGKQIKDLSSELTRKYPEVHWKGLAGMRDIVAHRYHTVDFGTIWLTITEEIPVLIETSEKILSEYEKS